jgi:3D (Asp-Asp-Asp) domain-containing protein
LKKSIIRIAIIIFLVAVLVLGIIYVDSVMTPDAPPVGTPWPPALLTEEELRTILDENKVRKQAPEEPQMVSLGEFQIYHYCPCVTCTESGNGITASGTTAQEGRTIAADWSVIEPGTEVYFNGSWYTVEDRGGGIRGNKIDVFVGDHQRALELGVYTTEVFALK